MDTVRILGPRVAWNVTQNRAESEAESRRLYIAHQRDMIARGGLDASFARAALRFIGEEA